MEKRDSGLTEHLDATSTPRSIRGEEDLRLRMCQQRTSEQTLQATKNGNSTLLPFKPT